MASKQKTNRVVIMGAAGRDFHNFNMVYRDDPASRVVAFTANQIPDISGRLYPPSLAGAHYPEGIPIVDESTLDTLCRGQDIDQVVFAYSDVSHTQVMHKASLALAAGADFLLLGPRHSMLHAKVPVIAICAVRTGCGKSQTTRWISKRLREQGLKVAVIRHPMPYGDLANQAVQRFASLDDLQRADCTIEEREEYEPHIDNGFVVYAGIDYEKILREAEKEADLILWDGGNNDTPFYRPDLYITLLDPHRPGHELSYYPGQTNFLLADMLIVNKVQTAKPEDLKTVLDNCEAFNPRATVVQCRSAIVVDEPELIRGKRALVVEDGPTLTHGGMSYGAGWFAAQNSGAVEIVDPVPYAVGSIKDTYEAYPNSRKVLPAMGYGEDQIRELEATINAVDADVVVEGTPIDLGRILKANKPVANVRYELEELEPGAIERAVRGVAETETS